jgi:hypothetical protein
LSKTASALGESDTEVKMRFFPIVLDLMDAIAAAARKGCSCDLSPEGVRPPHYTTCDNSSSQMVPATVVWEAMTL